MPKVASEISEPLSKANKITMISDGSGDIGAAKLTGELFFSLFFRFNFGFN
jgi:flotillin